MVATVLSQSIGGPRPILWTTQPYQCGQSRAWDGSLQLLVLHSFQSQEEGKSSSALIIHLISQNALFSSPNGK